MTEADFLRELEEIMELDVGSLRPEVNLADLDQWSSLAVVSLIALVDERMGLTLNARDIQKCATVRDIMQLAAQGTVG